MVTNQGEGAKLSQVIQIDEGKIQEHLGQVVGATEGGASLSEAKGDEAGGCSGAGGVGNRRNALFYYAFPREHWRCLRTNNPLERILREVRRRTRAVGAFPDGKSALMLAGEVALPGRHEVGHTTVHGHEPPSGCERSRMKHQNPKPSF
jgi:hypothetical protein